jgi:hypothetical protein
MAKFLVLYNSPIPAEQVMAQVTPEQAEAGMALWNEWAEKNGEWIVDLGAPLGSGKHVEPGAVSPGSGKATGFSILEADSLDDAVRIVENHPHFHTPDGTIDVLDFLEMPGMEGSRTP